MRVVIIKDFVKSHFPATPLLDYAIEVEKITTSKVDGKGCMKHRSVSYGRHFLSVCVCACVCVSVCVCVWGVGGGRVHA